MIGPEFWRRYFKVYDVLNLLPTYRQLLSDVCEELGAKQGESAVFLERASYYEEASALI